MQFYISCSFSLHPESHVLEGISACTWIASECFINHFFNTCFPYVLLLLFLPFLNWQVLGQHWLTWGVKLYMGETICGNDDWLSLGCKRHRNSLSAACLQIKKLWDCVLVFILPCAIWGSHYKATFYGVPETHIRDLNLSNTMWKQGCNMAEERPHWVISTHTEV